MSKKLVYSMVLVVVLMGVLGVSINIHKVEAGSGTIYIRADGSVAPDTAPISTVDNFTYTFTGNIYAEIIVEKNNTEVDGAGYSVQGTWDPRSKGIFLHGESNITIKNMEIRAFEYGVYLNSRSSNNTISGNKITENAFGVCLIDSSDNTINGNNITNSDVGIWLLESSNNKFYHNNFIGSTQQVLVETSGQANFWDNDVGGNYWSDYEERYPNATEIDDSGIWNTPYFIDESNQDNYPIVPEFPSPDNTPPTVSVLSPEYETYAANDVHLTFTVSESTSWIGYSLDGQENQTITGNTTLSELSDGLHSLIVYAEDTAGNVGASGTVQFTVEALEVEPFPIWTVVVIVIVAGAAAALLIYFTKIKKTTGKAK